MEYRRMSSAAIGGEVGCNRDEVVGLINEIRNEPSGPRRQLAGLLATIQLVPGDSPGASSVD